MQTWFGILHSEKSGNAACGARSHSSSLLPFFPCSSLALPFFFPSSSLLLPFFFPCQPTACVSFFISPQNIVSSFWDFIAWALMLLFSVIKIERDILERKITQITIIYNGDSNQITITKNRQKSRFPIEWSPIINTLRGYEINAMVPSKDIIYA